MRTDTLDRHYDYGNFSDIVSAAPSISKRQIRAIHRRVVLSFFELGLYREAMEFLLERVLECVRDDEFDTKEAYLLLARCTLHLGDPEESLRYARIALRMDRDDWESYFLIGRSLLLLGREEEGLKFLTKAIRGDCVQFSRAYRDARSALTQKNYERFVQDYSRARAYGYLIEDVSIQVFLGAKNSPRFRALLDRTVDRIVHLFETRDADLESFLAQAYRWIDDRERAVEIAKGCLEVDAFNSYAYLVLGMVAVEEGRCVEALGYVTVSLIHQVIVASDFNNYRWEVGLQLNPLVYTKTCRQLMDRALEGMGVSDYHRLEFSGEEPTYRDLKRLTDYVVKGKYREGKYPT